MFELVVGEIETILGNMGDEFDFSETVIDLWLANQEPKQLNAAFGNLGQQLLDTKHSYQEIQEFDEQKKKKLEGEEKEREQKRIEATKLELKHKLKDLHERSRLEVTAQLHSALIVWLQTVHINCQVIRKKQKSEVVAVWNPYQKQVEPLRCSVSNHPVTSFYLTDESAQIVCPTLWSS